MTRRTLTMVAFLCVAANMASATSLIAVHAIPARSVIERDDVRVSNRSVPGALSVIEDAVGMEARVTIYSGRPVRAGDLGPPAVIERNEIVRLRFTSGSLIIEADGRALDRGGLGDMISVMNLSSRSTVIGRIASNGVVEVKR